MTEPSIQDIGSSALSPNPRDPSRHPSRPPTGADLHTVTTVGGADGRADHRCPVQHAAAAVGVVLILVGIAGFVPGITDHATEIEFAGHHSPAELLGVFQVSVLHNLVHVLFGVAGLAGARRSPAARSYLVGGGVLYLLLLAYGLFVDETADANIIPLNAADDWLHLGLGLGMIALGAALWTHRTHDAYTSRAVGRDGERIGR